MKQFKKSYRRQIENFADYNNAMGGLLQNMQIPVNMPMSPRAAKISRMERLIESDEDDDQRERR